MNKIIFVLLLAITFNTTVYSQKLEKVKGNKNVTIQQTLIDPFHTIVVGEKLKVEIIYNREPSVEIEADDNLHVFILFEVVDSTLTFRTTRRITSKKRLNIKVSYDDALLHIESKDNGEISSLFPLDLENATLKASGTSNTELTIKADTLNIVNTEKAKIKLNLTASKTELELNGSSKIEAYINSPEINMNSYERAVANIEGNSDTISLVTDNNSKFNGKNFTTKTCSTICEISSDVTIGVTDTVTIEASGNSSVYLYNNPKIIINRFTDTAKLQKKVK